MPGRVWGATLEQAAGRIFAAACTFVALAVLARAMAPGDFGRYTFFLAIFAVLDALTDFGTGHAAVQRSSQAPERLPSVLGAARAMRRRMAAVGALAVAAGLVVFGEPEWPWVLAATLYQFTHGFELSATVYKNAIRWRVPVLARSFAALARLGAVLGLVTFGITGAGVHLFATAVASSLANFLLHLAARRHLQPPSRAQAADREEKRREASALVALAWPLGLAAVCQQGYFYLDNLFVRALEGDEALGRYNAAVRLMSFLLLGAQYAALSALPWFARRQAAGDMAFAATRLGQPLFAGACLVLGALAPHAGEILARGFGEPFRAAGPAMVWLLAAAAAVHAGAVLLTALVGAGRTRAVLAVAALALVLNALGNTLLVPRLGIEGAAAATFGTELFVAAAAFALLARGSSNLRRERPWMWAAGPALFGLAWSVSATLG